jgi:hypothetical protein
MILSVVMLAPSLASSLWWLFLPLVVLPLIVPGARKFAAAFVVAAGLTGFVTMVVIVPCQPYYWWLC